MTKKSKNFKKEEGKFLKKGSGHLSESKLEHLQKQYQSLLPEKINLLNQKFDDVRKAVNQHTLNSLKAEVHEIGQGANTYGYMQVCDLCNQFEQEISQKIKEVPTSTKNDEWLDDFDQSLKKIKEGFYGKEKKKP